MKHHRLLLPLPLFALAAMLSFPVSGLGQSILLSAGNFTLLGGTAITSTGTAGTTIRNGNIGLSPGATSGITGFPPAVVVNGAIIATGAVTGQARLDLITASVGLAGMASNANMSTIDLGGKTLAPGVYTFNGAALQSGALVLDAQGQNNVAWVFQVGTALTTTINSTITFINLGSNGGSDLGLFWNAGSAINIGANNQIAGNYLSGTSITFGGLSAGGGRALALAGVSLDTNVINAHGGFAGGDFTGGLYYSLSGAVVPSALSSGGSGTTTTIAPGTLNGGLGSIGGNVANNGTFSPGTNAPGMGVGSLNVAGNYVQSSTGLLLIQIASATSFDQLTVNGTATLAGTLQVDVVGGFNPLGLSYPIVVATGGITGAFSTFTGTVVTNRAAIGASLAYSPSTVTLSFGQIPFTNFATTRNQRAVGAAAQNSAALTTALDSIPLASQFPAALNALSPQGYSVWSAIAFDHGTALATRLARDDGTAPGRDNWYFDASEYRGRTRSDGDINAITFKSTNGLIGGNYATDPNTTVGGFISFGQTNADLGSSGSHTTVKEKMPGVRVAWLQDQWFAHAVLAYGFENYNSTRYITFPGTSAVATSSTRGHEWLGDFSFGRRVPVGIVTLSPFAGLLVNRWQANGFTETGAGAYNVTLAGQSARSLRTQAGLAVSLNLGIVQPHVRAAWMHELSDDPRAMNSSFGSINYAVYTREPRRDSGEFSAGLDFVLGPRALIYTDLTTRTGGDVKLLSAWRVGLAVSF
jgi:uncharacterized protein with beta-barrel porin domain